MVVFQLRYSSCSEQAYDEPTSTTAAEIFSTLKPKTMRVSPCEMVPLSGANALR